MTITTVTPRRPTITTQTAITHMAQKQEDPEEHRAQDKQQEHDDQEERQGQENKK